MKRQPARPKPRTGTTSPFSPAALAVVAKAAQTAALLRADIASLNTALTTGGNGTPAERLAHVVMLRALEQFVSAQHNLAAIAGAMLDH